MTQSRSYAAHRLRSPNIHGFVTLHIVFDIEFYAQTLPDLLLFQVHGQIACMKEYLFIIIRRDKAKTF